MPSAAAPRLLLIYPATHKLGWEKYFQLPSLALQQVAALTPSAWHITLVDELHDQVPFGGSFDLVGITAMTHQATRAYLLADRFREQGVPVVLGGIHPTVMPEEAATHANAVVIGEADPVWTRLLDDFCHGQLQQFYQGPLPGGSRLAIPWSRRELYPRRRYLTTQTLQASRGCPHKCPFCIVTNYFGSSFRYRDIDDILGELADFDRPLTVFLDDNLLGDPQRIKPILHGMKGMGLRWGAQANLRFAEDPELVRLVADAGCSGIFVGIESVTGDLATHPKTGSNGVSQRELIKRIRDAGIMVETSMIFGFDDHDESIFEKTVRYLEEVCPSLPTFNLLTPYPGTALFNEFKDAGRLLHTDWKRYNQAEVVYRPKLMTAERLYQGWLHARREAYRWPSIISRVTGNSQSRLTNLAYNFFRRGPNCRSKR